MHDMRRQRCNASQLLASNARWLQVVPDTLGKNPPGQFVQACKLGNQEHILSEWRYLSAKERRELLMQIKVQHHPCIGAHICEPHRGQRPTNSPHAP